MEKKCRCPYCGALEVKVLNADRNEYLCHACMKTFVNAKPKDDRREKSVSGGSGRETFYKRLMSKVVEIHAYFDGNVKAGSGFFVSPDYILTNAHVVFGDLSSDAFDNAATYIAGNDYSKSKKLSFDLIAADKKSDIAILKSNESVKEFAKFATGVYNGEQVIVIGNSLGEGLCVVDGIVSDVSRCVEGKEFFMTSAIVTHGNSGGPVFNNEGLILGMITEGSGTAVAMNYAIPVDKLEAYVKKVEEDEEIEIL